MELLVMMTFLLFAPASKRWLGWRKTANPEETAKVDFVTFIVQSYFDTLLRYVLSVTFCGAAVLKVMNEKTLVKRRWSYKVPPTVYIYKHPWRVFYVLSVTFCGAAVLKVMNEKTLVKRRWSYKVPPTVYIYKHPWRVCQTRVDKSLIRNNLQDTLSLPLGE